LRFWGKALTIAQINVTAKVFENNEPGLLETGQWKKQKVF
jgi:hypothetical protein